MWPHSNGLKHAIRKSKEVRKKHYSLLSTFFSFPFLLCASRKLEGSADTQMAWKETQKKSSPFIVNAVIYLFNFSFFFGLK